MLRLPPARFRDVPSPPPVSPSASRRIIHLGTTGPLEPELVGGLEARGVVATVIAEDTDPPARVDVVLVLGPPSPLIGRCRGRWPVIVAVDDPRATDVSRLLRTGANDVTRQPIQVEDLVSRIRRALVPPMGHHDEA